MSLSYEFKAQTIIDEGRTTQEAINQIKDWLGSSSFPDVPEEFIVLFLMSCKNEIEQTKDTIKAYFKIKRNAPEMFTDRDVDNEQLQKAVKVISSFSVPKRLNNNTVIHFFKVTDTNYRNFDWILAMKIAYMVLDISQRKNPPNELVVLIDMQGVGFMHLTRLKLSAAGHFLEFLQEAMPLRIKAIHILNANYIFDKLISIARVFIKADLFAILKSHSVDADMTQFQKEFIPATHLPKDYGGELLSVEELNEISVQQYRELKPFFDAEEQLIKSCQSTSL